MFCSLLSVNNLGKYIIKLIIPLVSLLNRTYCCCGILSVITKQSLAWTHGREDTHLDSSRVCHGCTRVTSCRGIIDYFYLLLISFSFFFFHEKISLDILSLLLFSSYVHPFPPLSQSQVFILSKNNQTKINFLCCLHSQKKEWEHFPLFVSLLFHLRLEKEWNGHPSFHLTWASERCLLSRPCVKIWTELVDHFSDKECFIKKLSCNSLLSAE